MPAAVPIIAAGVSAVGSASAAGAQSRAADNAAALAASGNRDSLAYLTQKDKAYNSRMAPYRALGQGAATTLNNWMRPPTAAERAPAAAPPQPTGPRQVFNPQTGTMVLFDPSTGRYGPSVASLASGGQ